MSDWITMGVSLVSSLLGGGAVAWAFRWRAKRAEVDIEAERTRRHDAKNATQIKVSEAEHDAAVAPLLADRLRDVEGALADKDAKIESLREAMGTARERDRAECERQRREDKVECERYTESRVAPLESALATIAGQMRRSMGPDDTGVHEVERIASGTPPVSPIPVRSDRSDMRLTIPPSGGESEER